MAVQQQRRIRGGQAPWPHGGQAAGVIVHHERHVLPPRRQAQQKLTRTTEVLHATAGEGQAQGPQVEARDGLRGEAQRGGGRGVCGGGGCSITSG